MQPNNCNKWSWPHCHQTQVIQSFHQMAPICTHMVLRPPHLKRHLNSLIHFCRAHAAYSIYCTRGCEVSLQNCPFSREGGSGPPRNEVVLPDISVARLAHRHTGHYSRALKWSKYIWTECNQSSDLDMQRVDPWLLVNTVTFPPVSFILNSSHTQTHTVIQTDCIASRHTATAESMGEASIQSNARISWNGTTATTTIIPV